MKTNMNLPGTQWPLIGGLLKIIWGLVYGASMTVQPFLRIPGTSGLQHFSLRSWFVGVYVVSVFWAAAERNSRTRAFVYFAACLASVTFIQQVSGRIIRWRGKAVPLNYVGHSLTQLVLRRPRHSKVILLDELLLCLLAGLVCWVIHEHVLGHWIVLAGLCNSAVFLATDPADFRDIELVTDRWAKAPPSCPNVRRITCRVI